MVAVCHEAAINALQEDINAAEILKRHFLSALDMVKPRTPSSLLELYKRYLQSWLKTNFAIWLLFKSTL